MIKIYKGGAWYDIHDETKQDKLVGTETTGQNIKTVNGETILGTGNISVSGEPAAYIKNIANASNVYTATKKDDSTISWTIPDISGKADTSTVTALSGRVDGLETTVAGKADSSTVEAIDTRLSTAETTLSGKAAQSDLTALSTRVETNETNITVLQTGKADSSALNSYILKTAIDDVTIKFVSDKLTATIPSVLIYKGSKTYVSEVLALTGDKGDVWFAQKDDRSSPQETAPVVNSLLAYNGTTWDYAGTTDADLSSFAKQADLTALTGRVSTNEGNITTLQTTVAGHTTSIAGKANQSSLDTTDGNVATNKTTMDNHIGNGDVHVTASQKTEWSGKQDEITSASMLSADLVDDSSAANKFVTETQKEKWDAKQSAIVYQEEAPTTPVEGMFWIY